MHLRILLVGVLFLSTLILIGISKSAEQPTTVETPKRGPIAPKTSAKTTNPQAERERKEKAAAEELARQKQLAAERIEIQA
jgi:hypothetical protein